LNCRISEKTRKGVVHPSEQHWERLYFFQVQGASLQHSRFVIVEFPKGFRRNTKNFKDKTQIRHNSFQIWMSLPVFMWHHLSVNVDYVSKHKFPSVILPNEILQIKWAIFLKKKANQCCYLLKLTLEVRSFFFFSSFFTLWKS